MKKYSILALALMVLCTGTTAEARYSGGTGEPNDPYRIATAADLNDIGNYEEDWGKHFILINDVNLAQYTGTQFKIIGRWILGYPNNKPFTGIFDGDGKIIWNFTWQSTNRYECAIGLFAYVGNGSQIKNLTLKNVNVNVTNGHFVGGLVGYNKGTISTISNCCVTGSVLGDYWCFGGLVGLNYGTIRDCYSTATVSGEDNVGGLVAVNSGGTITNCYSTGSISGGAEVGGLVGLNYGVFGTATITDCYSTGNVAGDAGVGGLVGENYYAYATISDCYSNGSVDGNSDVGGLVGDNHGATVKASFWDIQTSGQSTSDGGIGKTTAEMKTRSTFTDAGWDFIEIWGIGEGQTYPYLRFAPAGDFNYDKRVDLFDLAILASHWLEEK